MEEMVRVFYGYEFQSPIIGEVRLMEHPERVRRHYDHDKLEDMPKLPSLAADVRYLLDYMDGEYVGPALAVVLRRLRATVGV